MDSRTKKIFKLLSLLISSLVIGIASASTYNMFMNSTVGVKTTGMSFVAHNPDYTTCTGSITDNNQKVTFTTMTGIQGGETIYNPVDINNADLVGHDIELVLDSWTGVVATPLYNITISMYDSGDVQQGVSIVLVPGGGAGHVTTSGDITILDSTAWRVEWKVYWKGTALPGTDSVQVNLLLTVKS